MESHTFERHNFASYFIANLLLKLLSDNDVEDFSLSSDDDVAVEIAYRSGDKKIYTIRLKHLKERNLEVEELENYRDKFSIIRNFHDSTPLMPRYVILYTNASLQVESGHVLNLGNYKPTSIWENSLSILSITSENGKCYHLKNEKSGKKFRNFCKYFSLCTNQADVEELKEEAQVLFEKLFDCRSSSAFREYVQFISDWCQNNKLNKEWIRNVIAVCILKPFVQPLSFSSEVNENMKILREGIALFQTTVFDWEYNEKARKLWSDFKELTGTEEIKIKYPVISEEDKERSIILWLFDKCPLILAEAPEVYRAIEVFEEKKFIIFNPKVRLRKNSVFEKLSDLECYKIYEDVLKKFTCSVQGKEDVTLKDFFHGCPDVGEILTTSELLQMVDGPLIIGGRMEELPVCYVPRRVLKNVVNIKSLQDLREDALIVIDHFPKAADLEFYGKTIEQFLNNKEVYLYKGQCPRAVVEESNYYHFRYLSETLLEYISSPDINEIKYSIKKENFDRECGLYQNDKYINIICANPGMGKTTLMKSLKNNIFSTLWTVLIYARNYSSYFGQKKTNINDFLNHCLIETGENVSVFDQNVIRFLMYQKRIVILWDGLDELSDENLEIVMKLIHNAQVQGYQQWVTSRNHLKSTLEDEFNTLSRSLGEFDEKEQKIYMGERLNLDAKEVDDIFTKIQKNIASFPNNNILGIPLQSFMLTELFLQDREKYLNLLNEIFSLADLYEHFVAEKFNVYYKEKENLVEINESQRKRIERDKKTHVNSYEVAAIHTYFDKKIVSQLQTDFQNLSLILEEDLIGFVINATDDGLFEFCHNSFGEYFAALYLTKNHSDFFVTFDLVFEAKYDNIRLFYDLISAKGCKGHISVLYRNYELLTTCTDDEICKTDKFGRGTLEVACSWRKKYPLLQVTEDKLGKFKNKLALETTKDISNLQKVISFLVTHFTPAAKDKYDLFLNEDILLPFVSLKNDFEKLKMRDEDKKSVLLFAVALDFDIFDFCTAELDDLLLLNISLDYKSVNCLKKVVFYEFSKNDISEKTYVLYNILSIFRSNSLFDVMLDVIRDININFSSDLQYTLLHHACSDNNHEVASWLLENGASINVADTFGNSPLHVACRNGNYDIAKLLLNEASNSGEIVNHKNVYDETCLHIACRNGFVSIAELLLENHAMINDVDQHGQMSIHHASLSGNAEVLTLLIENGADVNAKDNDGNTPLHLAGESYQLTRILIDNGADLFALNNNETSVVHSTSDPKVLSLLIDSGVNLDSRDTKGRMLIHYVCSNEHEYSADFFDVLIENTSDVNAKDNDGLVPLHHLCLNGVNSDLPQEFLSESLHKSLTSNIKHQSDQTNDTNKGDSFGKIKPQFSKSVHVGNHENKIKFIEKLIFRGADINSKDHSGETPLHYACLPRENSSLELVEYLVKSGADVDYNSGKTPLHYACLPGESSSLELVQYLIKSGADINSKEYNTGKSPLHFACLPRKNSSVELVEYLIKSGADINSREYKSGKTPLHYACFPREHSSLELVEYLLKSGADINSREYNSGKTPLHYACLPRENSSLELVECLIKSGADINSREYNSGETPLHYACLPRGHSSLELVEYLIKSGADINSREFSSGKTPLHNACLPRENNSLELVQYLIKSGADINSQENNSGETPLHYACLTGENSSLELVKYLIKSGADINSREYTSGKTPLHYACLPREQNSLELVEYLIKSGADINSREYNSGKTPLHYACQSNQSDIVTLLVANGADTNIKHGCD